MTYITIEKEKVMLALEALKQERENYRLYGDEDGAPEYIHEAIKALEKALAQSHSDVKQEQPLPPVEIGVDVTSDGTSVVAFYRRPDAVMEMFYSQFHPLAKQEQGEPVGYIASMALNDLRDGIYGEIRVYHEELGGSVPIYTTPQQKRTWVGLTDDEIRDAIKQSEKVATGYAGWVGEQRLIWGRAIEAKLREKNSL